VDDVRNALAKTERPRPALLAETRAWMVGAAELGHRARWVEPARVVPHALRDLQREDCVLVHGYSSLCLSALIEAQNAGLAPRVLLSELAADASGKRMARELITHGVSVRLTWDLAAIAAVEAVDRVWLGCEAAGAGLCAAHVGTTLLLERAREAEVPTRVLATPTDLLPGGELELPAWGADEHDSLWCLAPEGVVLEAQPFELVDPDLADLWLTEAGPETFGEFCLRALRSEAAPAL
jgi:translation initiation factor 2B subunit (eIF-2B alpha/beta/delta family)